MLTIFVTSLAFGKPLIYNMSLIYILDYQAEEIFCDTLKKLHFGPSLSGCGT